MGCICSKRNPNKEVLLMKAAKMGEDKDLQYLLKSGADVNTRDEQGCTALIYAALYGHTKCVNLLIQAGADLNILKDFYPRTTLTLALSGHVKCGRHLVLNETRGKAINSALHCAFHTENDNVVKLIIQAGADVNFRQQFFRDTTVLIESAKRGWYQCVNAALTAGADVNATDILGQNALMYSSSFHNMQLIGENLSGIKCVQLLLKAGAHVNRTDRFGYTALSELIYYHQFKGGIKHYANLLKLLVAAGEILNWNPQIGLLKEFVHDFLTNDLCLPQISLMHMCRETIGIHLIQMNPVNLFITIPQLGLPSVLESYLLYYMSLDVEYEHYS